MAHFSAQPVRTVYEAAASTEPTPGGGVITALSAMLGLALVLKAVRITRRHNEIAQFAAVEPELERLAHQFELNADADAEGFARFIAAARLPHATQQEGETRRAGRDEAAAASAEAAIATLRNARSAIRLTRKLRPKVHEVVAPDIAAGLRLLHVARRNAIDNAMGNLEAVSDPALKQRLLAELEQGERI